MPKKLGNGGRRLLPWHLTLLPRLLAMMAVLEAAGSGHIYSIQFASLFSVSLYIYVWSSMAISHIVLNDADSLEGKIAYLEMRQKGKRDKRGQASCTRLSVYIDTHISARVYVFAYLHAFVFLLQWSEHVCLPQWTWSASAPPIGERRTTLIGETHTSIPAEAAALVANPNLPFYKKDPFFFFPHSGHLSTSSLIPSRWDTFQM